MAGRTQSIPFTGRVNSDRAATPRLRGAFEDGNTVRLLDIFDEEPHEKKRSRTRDDRMRAEARAKVRAKERAKARARARVRARRSGRAEEATRAKALAPAMSAGFVIAITMVSILTVVFCIHYLKLRSQVIHQSETIAAMETSLSRLKADNDAYENSAQASVNMEDVKETALNKLGMHYATESQIRYYNADDESYVRQYEKLGGG